MMTKYCEFNGCDAVITKGRYCSVHKPTYKRTKRPTYVHKNKPFYRTREWKDLCFAVDVREGDQCQRCHRLVFGKHKQHHHIVPIQVDPSLRLDPDNIMLLCEDCHPIVEHENEDKPVRKFASYFGISD